jgi:metallo-beta-lactamase class B
MSRHLAVVFCSVLLLASWIAIDANAQAAVAEAHVAAARAAIAPREPRPYHVLPKRTDYHAYQALFDGVCAEPKLPDVVRQDDRGTPLPRSQWYAPPAIVFDNLYFIGSRGAGVWAINTSAGIILIDTNFDWNVTELAAGLLQFGLDPANIKYILITHAHDDRYWGAKTLQDLYPSARVVMSEADWNVVAKDNSPAKVKPRKDMVATDGQKVTLGDATVTLYITPGHTPGTLSMIISPLKYGNERHVGSVWGGTDIGIGRQGLQYYPDMQTMLKTDIASLKRFREIGERAGVDTIIATNNRHGNNLEKIRTLRIMNPDESGGGQAGGILEDTAKVEDDPHPFVSKDAVNRYYTIIEECYQAQLAWRTGK